MYHDFLCAYFFSPLPIRHLEFATASVGSFADESADKVENKTEIHYFSRSGCSFCQKQRFTNKDIEFIITLDEEISKST